MKTAALIAAARAAIAKTYPSSTDLILVSVESYGQRRLYPITAAADTIAALVGAKTIEERHLPLAERLGLSVVIVPAQALAVDAPAALRSARKARDAEKIAEATAGAWAAIDAVTDAAPDHQVGSAWQEDGGRRR
jgi:hypothetical protein